jgi:hypothetical protein
LGKNLVGVKVAAEIIELISAAASHEPPLGKYGAEPEAVELLKKFIQGLARE